MIKRFLSLALCVCVMLSCIIATDYSVINTKAETVDYGLVDDVQDGQILQCWNWSFDNIKDNMATIASQGFSAIQTSPIQASKESTKESWSNTTNFWVYYQPINFSIETNTRSALGTKTDFEEMCEVAHEYGIKVIVDTVFNHLANGNSDNTLNSQSPSDITGDSSCWHSITTNISNYSDRYDITHNCLGGLPDLNTGSSKIQSYAIGFLKECIDAGADGFRFDAAKHIETPSDSSGTSSNFWPNVLNAATSYAQSSRGITPYYYGEMLDSTGGVDISAYTTYMSVTDNQTGNNIRNAINSGSASGACAPYVSNGAATSKTVQWNESHDTYAEGSSNYVSETNVKKTWALVGSRNEVCGMYLARPSSSSTMLGAADVTGWADKEVQAINHFKNHFVGQSEYFAYSGNIVYNERGTSGVVLVNTSGTSTSVSVTANKMASGTYTDAITGNTFTVSGGKISGNIGSTGIAVVYDTSSDSSSDITTPTTSTDTTLSGETKTVYVGVIEYITSKPTLHYWNNSGVEGDATLTATGETVKHSVGSAYWSNASQTFNVYKTEIPVEATGFKTYDSSTSSNWAEEDITYAENQITLVFEYSGLYHNVTASYTPTEPTEEPTEAPTEEPTEEPAEAPTEEPTEEPTEAPTEEPTEEQTEAPTEETTQAETEATLPAGYYLVGTLNGVHCWDLDASSIDRMLVESTGETAPYTLDYTFVKGDEIKVVYYDGTSVTRWYNSSGSNYSIGSSKAGDCTLYFNPNGNSSWSYYYFTVQLRTVEETEAPTETQTEATEASIAVKVENIVTSPSATNMGFTWDAVENGFKYWVYKYNAETDTWASAASSYTNSAVVKLLDADTTYQFKVICKFNDGTVMSLDDADVITATTSSPVATTSITGTADIVEATISWEAVDGATKYWVYKATSESGPFYIYTSSYETSLTVRKLKPDTTYYFKVVALTSNNGIATVSNVNDSPTVAVTTKSSSLIATSLSGTTANTATISWPSFANADKYWLLYSTTSSDPDDSSAWTTLTSTTDVENLSYTFKNLTNNTNYYLNVVARYTDASGEVRTINYIPVQARTIYSDTNFITFTQVSDTSVTLSWHDEISVQKTWVYVYDSTGTKVTQVSTTTNSVTITKLSDMTNYTYALYVLDADGNYGFITPESGFAYTE